MYHLSKVVMIMKSSKLEVLSKALIAKLRPFTESGLT